MDQQEQFEGEEERRLDLRFYWQVVKKRWWMIAAVACATTALAVVHTSRKPKIYRATATVIVDPQAPNVLGDRAVEVVSLGSGNMWINTEYYNTLFRVVTSRQLARMVVEKYRLQHDARLVHNNPQLTEKQVLDAATGAVQGRVSVGVIGDSRVFSISVTDVNPKLAADLANMVADVFIAQNVSVKRDATTDAKGWVAKQLDEARHELDRTERALIAYKEDNNILSVSLEDRQNLLTKSLEDFSSELTITQKKRIDVQSRRKAVAELVAADALNSPTSVFETSSTIISLREKFFTERQSMRALEDRYGPKHPEAIAQSTRVAAAREALVEEGQTIVRALDAELKALMMAEASYKAQLERLTKEAFEVNKKEIEYKRLSRNTRSAEDSYKQLLARLNESGLQAESLANNIRPLDDALVPGAPIAPNPRSAAMMGFALGLMLAMGLAFLIEFMDRSVKSQEDVEQTLKLSFLGIVPSLDDRSRQPELGIHRQPDSIVAESCRVLRTNILFSSADKPLRTLVVTSSNPKEGKTMTVVNLGITMAQSGHRTLIVDTDMRRPRLHKAMGVPNDDGVSRVVVGEADLDKAIKSTEVPNLFILPCGPIPPNPAELLQTEKFAALARTLQGKFDRIIFDSPPVLALTDAAILSRVADGTVLVVRAGQTSRDAVARAKRSITNVNANIVGVVLNDVNLKSSQYAGYSSYYNYRYKQDAPAAARGDQG